MMQIVPAILSTDFREVQRDLAQYGMLSGVDVIHLDILDGVFVPGKSDFSAEEFLEVTSLLDLEIHLMVQHPMESLLDWLAHPNVARVIVHAESALSPLEEFDKAVSDARKTWSVALNPETPATAIVPFVQSAKGVMCMGIHPGKQGQVLLPDTYEKIRTIQKTYPELPLTVDGGVDAENIALLAKAGAGRAVVGSFLKHGTSAQEQLSRLAERL